jgi:hypothetical protein
LLYIAIRETYQKEGIYQEVGKDKMHKSTVKGKKDGSQLSRNLWQRLLIRIVLVFKSSVKVYQRKKA